MTEYLCVVCGYVDDEDREFVIIEVGDIAANTHAPDRDPALEPMLCTDCDTRWVLGFLNATGGAR